ncbi:hypothetical protein OCK74_26100 [Chitinophagaceae bacterium LB-8]|uniref:Heparinase II/III-like protein n=1 Tax=Paraflavisolibacter caeni TaxID=2982496 RepID=A0A9X2XZQ6_9BACT|nr:hypothetical protein [Paraflavisolibacter caeni]MCU7552619.1 hypothetical protein [Paraflavisolibacter caeni]
MKVKRYLFFLMAVLTINTHVFSQPVEGKQMGRWLSSKNERTPSGINDFLQNLDGKMRLLVCRYENNVPAQITCFDSKVLEMNNCKWQAETKVTQSSLNKDEVNCLVKFKLLSGSVKSTGVALAFDFNSWTINNYVFAPAMLYGGNRFKILPLQYPPYIRDAKDRPLDMPITTTNILHLNQDGSNAKVEMNTGNLATPMMGFFDLKDHRGFLLLTEQNTRFGNNGMLIEEEAAENTGNKKICFVVNAPGVRNEKYVMCGRAPSGDQAADWKAGDEITLRFNVYNFEAKDIPEFYQKVFTVRKALSGQNSFSNSTPYSEAARLIVEMHNKNKWFENDTTAYYCHRPGDKSPYSYQVGWSGLPIFSFPQLVAATPERLNRVVKSFDNMLFKSQAPTGLFYAANHNGKIYGDPHGQMETLTNIAMIRRSMEVLYFGIKSLDLLKKQNHQDLINPQWEGGLRKCADALLKVWDKYGQFGQFINVDNLEMNINGSTAGAYAGAGLALASVYFNDQKYLEIAETATNYYYNNFLLKGYSGGGPAEILQAPDSETLANMLEACMVLFDVTQKPEWIEKAKFLAHYLSTFMVSYDYQFPKGSAMQKAGTHAAGSLFASSQNNHSAPGYYILPGDMLLKLYRATGDEKIAALYKDQTHNVIQYVGAPHSPLRKQSGFVTERVQISDWEGNDQGSVNNEDSNTAWEILAALSATMNPGIYLHTDDETFLVMDHVEAKIIERNQSGLKLRITNPTPYDAIVSILSETAAEAKKPLPLNSFINWQKVNIKTGETVTIQIKKQNDNYMKL